MANESDPELDNLGIGLGTRSVLGTEPVLETGGQQRWDACMAEKEKVVTHWRQRGSQDRPQCLSSSTGGGFTAGSALELAEAAPSTAWRALFSCCHASEGFENFLSNAVLLTVGVLEMQRWKVAERAKT